jgi:hypothetical protein
MKNARRIFGLVGVFFIVIGFINPWDIANPDVAMAFGVGLGLYPSYRLWFPRATQSD